MTWFKVDDQLAFHPKVLEAGNGAMGGWVRLGSHCAAHETDGFATAKVVHAIFAPDELEAIMRTGQLIAHADGRYEMHDYLKYNPSHADLESKRTQWVAKRVHVERRGDARIASPIASPGDAHVDASGDARVASGTGRESGSSDLETEDPDGDCHREPLTGAEQTRVRKLVRHRPKTHLPEDWAPPAAEHAHSWHQEARKHGLTRGEVETALNEFKLHWAVKGEPKADWGAAWRLWLSRVRAYGRKPAAREVQQPALPGEHDWAVAARAKAKVV